MSNINKIVKDLTFKNSHEKEFVQAVNEVMESIVPFVKKNSKYNQQNILSRLVEPERAIIFRVPWVDRNGKININRGYRVQFNSAIGPYKGGLRFHPSVNLSIIKFLGFEQIIKNSLTGLPIGGGKGGSDFDPKGKTDVEVMSFCQSFMNELFRHIGHNTDVPAGDIGVGHREIGFLFGQYKKIKNNFTGVLTGKGVEWGGSLGRPEATGYGVIFFAQEMLLNKKDSLEGKKVVISGSGNVAQFCCEKAIDLGATVLTMSDSSGFIYDKSGIDSKKLDFIKKLKNEKRGRIKEYADKYNCNYYASKSPWSIPCDLAFPCATQNELNFEDAKELVKNGCFLVAEGANMPTTPKAINVLLKSKVLYAPGKASNAGGVAVSGLEMSQNSLRNSWTKDEVECKLKIIMQNIHNSCLEYGSNKNNVNYIDGANIAGFVKVANAMIDQGAV